MSRKMTAIPSEDRVYKEQDYALANGWNVSVGDLVKVKDYDDLCLVVGFTERRVTLFSQNGIYIQRKHDNLQFDSGAF